MLDGVEIVYVAHAPARRILSVSVTVAPVTPRRRPRSAARSSRAERRVARCRSAAVDPTDHREDDHSAESPASRTPADRAQGYALVDQELEEGLRALAAPIRDSHGRVIAAVNVAVHASRWTVDAIEQELLPKLLDDRGSNRARRPRVGLIRSGTRPHATRLVAKPGLPKNVTRTFPQVGRRRGGEEPMTRVLSEGVVELRLGRS